LLGDALPAVIDVTATTNDNVSPFSSFALHWDREQAVREAELDSVTKSFVQCATQSCRTLLNPNLQQAVVNLRNVYNGRLAALEAGSTMFSFMEVERDRSATRQRLIATNAFTSRVDWSISITGVVLSGLLFCGACAVATFAIWTRKILQRTAMFCVLVACVVTTAARTFWWVGQTVGYGLGDAFSNVAMSVLSRVAYTGLVCALAAMCISWITAVHYAVVRAGSVWVPRIVIGCIVCVTVISSVYFVTMGPFRSSVTAFDASQVLVSSILVVFSLVLIVHSGIVLHYLRTTSENVRHQQLSVRNAWLMLAVMVIIFFSVGTRFVMVNFRSWSAGGSTVTLRWDQISFTFIYILPETLIVLTAVVVALLSFRMVVARPRELATPLLSREKEVPKAYAI
jgi:uncharacterized membrane protein YidH (DUF202 family)